MPCYTYLQEFKFNKTIFPVKNELIKKLSKVQEMLGVHGFKPITDSRTDELFSENDSFFQIRFNGEHKSDATLRGYPPDLITLDICEFVVDKQQNNITEQAAERIKEQISHILQCDRAIGLPAIKRGQDVEVYFPTAGGQLIEYDFDKCVFQQDSEFQNIKIMHSPQFGNMLILDDDPNLAESDLAYTHAIMGYDNEDYRNKTVLILGGGDGGILHEVLKQQPKFITMVDIDKIVVEQAIKNLRGICHNSLDSLNGENYQVIIADCIPILKDYVKENKTFDFVINDLTAIPVTSEPVGNHWDFLKLILDLSMDVLAPTGKYYTQGNGANMVSALKMYEEQLKKLKYSAAFKKQTVCVPSYHELWVFYEIWKQNEQQAKS